VKFSTKADHKIAYTSYKKRGVMAKLLRFYWDILKIISVPYWRKEIKKVISQ